FVPAHSHGLVPGRPDSGSERAHRRFRSVRVRPLHESRQILNAKLASAKRGGSAAVVLGTLVVHNQHAPAWFHYTCNSRKSLTLERVRQVVHDERIQHPVERLVRHGEPLNPAELKVDAEASSSRLPTSAGEQPG